MDIRIRTHNRYGIAKLKHFFIAEDRALISVCFAPGIQNTTVNPVTALHVLMGKNILDTMHFFSL